MVDKTQRRLAAILAADVAGYTQLVEQDTDGTVAAWAAARDDVVKPLVDEMSGQIIKFTGDGFLVEFPSVQNAVLCAITMQDQLKSSPLDFRMGINVGDIVDDGGDVHGEGVNIDARLEALAEPGGICISGDVYNQVRNRIDAEFRDMGEKEIKHVSQPIRVYAIGVSERSVSGNPVPELPDKPSIAVLPFDNMSGDPEQEYFSDGITEDIITELSRFSMLFVIARHSSFAFKGEKVDIKEIGEKLGVQYVLEGSVRKAGNRVRISAQLIEAETGNHLWAERYDRELTDIFAVQDEVTQNIVAVLPSHIERAIADRAARKPTENMKAYEYLLQGNIHFHRQSPDEIRKARQLYERAIELDPRFAQAHARLGDTHNADSFQGWGTEESPSLALSHARTSIELDPEDCFARQVLVFAYLKRGLWEEAEDQLDIALSLNSSDAENLMWAGEASSILGRHPEAVALIKQAMRLDPMHPNFYRGLLGQALYCLRDYQRAVQALGGGGATDAAGHAYLAAAYGKLGERTKAEDELAQFQSRRQEELESSGISPAGSVLQLVQHMSTYYSRGEDWEHLLEGLRKAGLPD